MADRARLSRGDDGATMLEYAAVVGVIAAIVATIGVSGIGETIGSRIESAICTVASGDDCGQPVEEDRAPEPADGDSSAEPPSDEEWGGRATDPNQPPPDPTDAERERAGEAADEIRDYINDDDAWYKPWTWGGDDPDHPADVLGDMSPGELYALFDELSDDEIRRLLDVDGVPEILRLRADPHLLLRLEQIAPHSIEPDVTDVRDTDGEKYDEPATGYGHLDGDLYGNGGVPSLDDIDQGTIGDCWWMASLGAVAHENPELIKNMIRENPNGTYTVTFPDGEQVTVTSNFPVNDDGDLTYAQPGQPPVLWPLVMEKALAEKEGSYGELVSGRATNGMEILTGESSDSHNTGDISRSDLEGWIDEGAVTVSSMAEDDAKGPLYDNDEIMSGHAYIVDKVNDDGTVVLYNPWGGTGARVTVTMDELNEQFRRVDTNPVD